MSLMTENGTGAADGDGLWLDPTDGEEEAVTPATGDDVGDTVLREEGGGKAGREAPGEEGLACAGERRNYCEVTNRLSRTTRRRRLAVILRSDDLCPREASIAAVLRTMQHF